MSISILFNLILYQISLAAIRIQSTTNIPIMGFGIIADSYSSNA